MNTEDLLVETTDYKFESKEEKQELLYWRCAKLYIDESWIEVIGKGQILILGTLVCPPGCRLESELENVRQEIGFIDEINSSALKGDKGLEVGKTFVARFMSSDALFRVIIMPKKEPEFSKYCYGEPWRLVSKGIKLLLNNLYISKDLPTRIIKPKIILDQTDTYSGNINLIQRELLLSLRLNEEFSGQVFRRFPGAVLGLVDSKIFDSLQLTDILISAIKWDILEPDNDNFRQFKESVKMKLGIGRLKSIARWNTSNKFDVWPFKEAKEWLNV